MPMTITRAAAFLSMAVASIALARADDLPFVGTWSLDPANCAAGQESENAPMVITRERYDQHETHCTFKSVAPAGSDWKVAGDCTVEGSPMPYDFTLTLSGDTLTFTDDAGPRDFLRCK